MRNLLLLGVLVVLVVLVAACGVRPTGVVYGAAAPTATFDGPVLFFLRGPTLTRVTRPPTELDDLALLAAGPTDAERSRGLTTEIPADAAPITMSHGEQGISVSISSAVAELADDAEDQIACTVAPPWGSRREVVLTGTDTSVLLRSCSFEA